MPPVYLLIKLICVSLIECTFLSHPCLGGDNVGYALLRDGEGFELPEQQLLLLRAGSILWTYSDLFSLNSLITVNDFIVMGASDRFLGWEPSPRV